MSSCSDKGRPRSSELQRLRFMVVLFSRSFATASGSRAWYIYGLAKKRTPNFDPKIVGFPFYRDPQ